LFFKTQLLLFWTIRTSKGMTRYPFNTIWEETAFIFSSVFHRQAVVLALILQVAQTLQKVLSRRSRYTVTFLLFSLVQKVFLVITKDFFMWSTLFFWFYRYFILMALAFNPTNNNGTKHDWYNSRSPSGPWPWVMFSNPYRFVSVYINHKLYLRNLLKEQRLLVFSFIFPVIFCHSNGLKFLLQRPRRCV